MVAIARIDVMESAQQSIGNQLDIVSRGNVIESGCGRRLVEASLDAVGDARPEKIFVGARDTAVENDAPLLQIGAGETQALERDAHQQHVTLAGEAGFGVPDCVERRIETAEIGGQAVCGWGPGPKSNPPKAGGVCGGKK